MKSLIAIVPLSITITICLLVAECSRREANRELAAYYVFAASGIILRDISGNENHGKIFGAVWVRAGDDAALDFDGYDDYVDCGDNESLRISEALTLAVWVRVNHLRGNQYVVSKHGWNIYIASDGLPRFETRDARDSRWDVLTARHKVSAGKWTFIATVHNPKARLMEIYVNGRLSNSKPRTNGRIGGVWRSKLLIGMYATRTHFLDGLIAELRIYKRALAEWEIAALYQQGLKRMTDALRSPSYRISLHPRFYFTEGERSADVFI